MVLPEIIAECEKLETVHKKTLINKLTVALSILKQIKGAEHLYSNPEPKKPPLEAKVVPVARRASGKTVAVNPMPEGG